nr:MAG TPA: hypothetical protein [Caudoviricetes sp.]
MFESYTKIYPSPYPIAPNTTNFILNSNVILQKIIVHLVFTPFFK